LSSYAQGWNEPLNYAGFTPFDDCTLDVSVQDESARLPLVKMSTKQLTVFFEEMDVPSGDAERLADVIADWMDANDSATSNSYDGEDYEKTEIPCKPTNALPRSFDELLLVEGLRPYFIDKDGVRTELFRVFKESFSLQNDSTVNINNAPDFVLRVLAEIGDFDDQQVLRRLEGTDRRRGTSDDEILDSTSELSSTGDVALVGFSAQLLRVRVVASRGESHYAVEALVQLKSGGGSGKSSADSGTKPKLSGAYEDFPDSPASTLAYPFKILQLTENQSPD
jgi:general secretion pathway protein K